MNRNQERKLGLGAIVLALAAALGGSDVARAQEPATAQLSALLAQLHKTDAKAWQSRAAAMKAAAGNARETAKTLREQAATKEAAAVVEQEAGKRLAAEIKKLAQVRAMVAELKFRDPAGAGEAKSSVQGQLELALAGLQKLPAAAWEARAAAMRKKGVAHETQAAELKRTSQELAAQGNAKDATAKKLDEEVGKLEQLRKLVGSLAPDALAMAGPAKKPAAVQPVASPKTEPAMAKPAKKAPAKAAPKDNTADFVTYADHVQPIFEANCFDCHGSDDPSSGLDLSSHATALQGGSSGRTIRPGNPDESRLYLLVSHKERPTMPKDAPRLDKQLIDTIHTWIAQGAANDLAQAKTLAAERAAAREKARKAAAAREASKVEVQAVLPTELATVRKRFPQRPGALRALAASPGAPLLAAPGFHQILLLHQDNLQQLGVLDFPYGQVEALSFSADGTTLVAAGGVPAQQGGCVLYDVRTGRELGRFGEQRDVVLSATVSPRGAFVAVGNTRRNLEVFRVRDALSLWQQKHEDWVTAVTFSADGKLLASADRQGNVQVREAGNGREVHTMKAADGLLADLAFSPDSRSLATAGADRSVCLYRMRDGRRLFKKQRHTDQVLCITWRTNTRLLTSGADGRVFHWKTNGDLERELPRIGEWVYDIAASADGTRVFTADWRGRLTAIDAKNRKVLGAPTLLAVTQ